MNNLTIEISEETYKEIERLNFEINSLKLLLESCQVGGFADLDKTRRQLVDKKQELSRKWRSVLGINEVPKEALSAKLHWRLHQVVVRLPHKHLRTRKERNEEDEESNIRSLGGGPDV